MESQVLRHPKLVVGLDIGSTYSGYAWQWRGDYERTPGRVEFNKSWGAGPMQWHKTTTCLLLDEKREINSFGFQAEKRFYEEWDRQGHFHKLYNKWYFFKYFKMPLYQENFRDNVDDSLGQFLPLMEVMSKFIRALKTQFLKRLRDKGHAIRELDILWVLTVPAIWTDSAKNFMRTAAELADIPQRNLLLALEPEAAAIHCLFLPTEEQRALDNLGQEGDKFIVADLGGGTTDITAVEVVSDGRLREIVCGEGGRGGGQDINNAFFQMCNEVFTGPGWRTYWEKNKGELLELENDFERKKVEIGQDTDEFISLNLPSGLIVKINEGEVTCSKESCFKQEGRKFLFDSAYIRDKLFGETIQLVLEPLVAVLERTKSQNISKLVLVGGFAESSIVQERLKLLLRDKGFRVNLLVPTCPLYAVLQGAVLYGHNPNIFKSRISRFTYGVAMVEEFKDGIHDERRKQLKNGMYICKNVFSTHVLRDQVVELGTRQPTMVYTTVSKRQRTAKISIYRSASQSPKYVDTPGCTHLGDIRMELTKAEEGTEIRITMIYGGAELVIEAFNSSTDKTSLLTIDFNKEAQAD